MSALLHIPRKAYDATSNKSELLGRVYNGWGTLVTIGRTDYQICYSNAQACYYLIPAPNL